jgi:putative transposase
MAYRRSSNSRKRKQEQSEEALIASLYQQIGQLKVQVDWLEKNQNFSVEEKRALIDPTHRELSIRQQCKLLGLTRSSYYYEAAAEREENLVLMRLLDERYTRTPISGSRKMTAWLHTQGYPYPAREV